MISNELQSKWNFYNITTLIMFKLFIYIYCSINLFEFINIEGIKLNEVQALIVARKICVVLINQLVWFCNSFSETFMLSYYLYISYTNYEIFYSVL